jgi:serine/threonine protein kinase
MQGSPYVGNKYILQEKIGQGKFGKVYRGQHSKTNEPVAIKFESLQQEERSLKHEVTLLKYLQDRGCGSIPLVHWFGRFEENVACVMSFYEGSLLDHFQGGISIEKRNRLFIRSISILESIHDHYVLHRDIKPQNFRVHNQELYIIDFGLSTFYVDSNLHHVENFPKKDTILGSPKYASYNIHNGDTNSRRDDLISLGYMGWFLYERSLPWENIANEDPANRHGKSELELSHPKNLMRKDLKTWENLDEKLSKMDKTLHAYLKYCYRLSYQERPNYNAFIELFSSKLE